MQKIIRSIQEADTNASLNGLSCLAEFFRVAQVDSTGDSTQIFRSILCEWTPALVHALIIALKRAKNTRSFPLYRNSINAILALAPLAGMSYAGVLFEALTSYVDKDTDSHAFIRANDLCVIHLRAMRSVFAEAFPFATLTQQALSFVLENLDIAAGLEWVDTIVSGQLVPGEDILPLLRLHIETFGINAASEGATLADTMHAVAKVHYNSSADGISHSSAAGADFTHKMDSDENTPRTADAQTSNLPEDDLFNMEIPDIVCDAME